MQGQAVGRQQHRHHKKQHQHHDHRRTGAPPPRFLPLFHISQANSNLVPPPPGAASKVKNGRYRGAFSREASSTSHRQAVTCRLSSFSMRDDLTPGRNRAGATWPPARRQTALRSNTYSTVALDCARRKDASEAVTAWAADVLPPEFPHLQHTHNVVHVLVQPFGVLLAPIVRAS